MSNTHDLHVRLWHWQSENLDKSKADWPEWETLGEPYDEPEWWNSCFACYEADTGCGKCPLEWPFFPNNCMKSIYWQFGCAQIHERWDVAKRLAIQIRDLPWRTRND